jgi:hypothetical protein
VRAMKMTRQIFLYCELGEMDLGPCRFESVFLTRPIIR